MTAFAGLLAWHGGGISPHHIGRFEAALALPGGGTARNVHRGGALLVHVQSITAPQDRAARQPMAERGGRFALVFDGYLTNREELADVLGLGAEGRGLPDCAYALAAMERWGEQAATRLLGDFALAAWDWAGRRLILSRDPMGQRPLYYHEGDGWMAFSTSVRALRTLPELPAGLDEQRMAYHLLDLPGEPDRTFHTAIRRLPPASTAVFDGRQAKVDCYWRPDYGRRLHYRRDEEYVEAARELLDRSVGAHLRIAGPAVAVLSGGLDSSAVATSAARQMMPGTLFTVTTVPEAGVPFIRAHNAIADERPHAEATARLYANIVPSFVSGSRLHRWDDRWAEMFLLVGRPWRNIMNFCWFAAMRDHAREIGAKVLLEGAYGNLTLSWDGTLALPHMLRTGRWGTVVREVRAMARHYGVSFARQFWRSALRPIMPYEARAALDRVRGRVPEPRWVDNPINPDFAASVDGGECLRRCVPDIGGDPASIRQSMLEWVQSSGDALGQLRHLVGLEIRNPLGERRLLEFCLAVPQEQYLRGGVGRFLARRVLAGRLPPEVLGSTRRGFQAAEYFHRMGQMRGVIASGVEELERSALARRMLDLPRMKALLARWPEDPSEAGIEYLSTLHRGLHYGQFLRWMEGGN